MTIFGLLLTAACHHAEAPVAPGEPIPAEPEIVVKGMDEECQGLIAALDAYGKCPHADGDDRAWARAVAEVSQQSFDAGKKGTPDADAQHVIAVACHKAATSIHYATVRCEAGPRPRAD